MWGYTLKAQLENKSTEKTYMFSVESASINGVQCDPMFASEVAAGKKANEEINFSTDTLEENGIVEWQQLQPLEAHTQKQEVTNEEVYFCIRNHAYDFFGCVF